MPSSPSSPIFRLDCPSGRPQALVILLLLVPALGAVAWCGLPLAAKAAIATLAIAYAGVVAAPCWRRPAAAVLRDARGGYWFESEGGRTRLECVQWRDYGHLLRLQAELADSGRRLRLVWHTAALPHGLRRAARVAMNATPTPRRGALPATVANPLL